MSCKTIQNQTFPVLILAAGLSIRMKRPKLFLKWNASTTFAEHLVQMYAPVCETIVLVVNSFNVQAARALLSGNENIIIVENNAPEKGRFLSVKAGLSVLQKPTGCFIQNIDNPFTETLLLRYMLQLSNPNAYVVPTFGGKSGHPVLIGSLMVKALKMNTCEDFNFRYFLESYRRIECPFPKQDILVNINTDGDYQKYFKNENL